MNNYTMNPKNGSCYGCRQPLRGKNRWLVPADKHIILCTSCADVIAARSGSAPLIKLSGMRKD